MVNLHYLMSCPKYRLKNPRHSEVCLQKINYDLRYLIQFLDGRSNYVWPFPFPKKTISDQFNDMNITVEVKLASALNRHQGRQLCCVKRDDLEID